MCPENLGAHAATGLHVDEYRVKDLSMDIRRNGLSSVISIISHCLVPLDLVRSDCVTKVIYPLCQIDLAAADGNDSMRTRRISID